MSRVWYCVACGYEVDRGGRCHNCKEPLVESPLAELEGLDPDDEVGYRLTDWADSQRGELIEALVAGEIAHRFEGDELVVAADDEATVDAIVEQVSNVPGAGDAAADTDEDAEADEATIATLEAVLHAARRLRTDPTDMAADGELAEAGADIFAIDHVYGVDSDIWAAIGRVTRRLLAALGADVALENEISGQAAVLCRLVEPIVSPQAQDAVPWGVTRTAFLAHPMGPAVYTPPEPLEADLVAGAEDSAAETPHGDRHEVVYDLAEWLPEQRAELDVALDLELIAHHWEGTDVIVNDVDWDRVDSLCDQINPEGVAAIDTDGEGGEDDGYHAMSELFGAANRLAGDPEDKAKRQTVLDASAEMTGAPVPFGMPDDQWWQIKTRLRLLCDTLATDAGPDVVRTSAGALSDLLRGFV